MIIVGEAAPRLAKYSKCQALPAVDDAGPGILGTVIFQTRVNLLQKIEPRSRIGRAAVVGPSHELPVVERARLDRIAFIIKAGYFEMPCHVFGRLHFGGISHE